MLLVFTATLRLMAGGRTATAAKPRKKSVAEEAIASSTGLGDSGQPSIAGLSRKPARHSMRRGVVAATALAVMLTSLVGLPAMAADQTTGGWMFFASEDKQDDSDLELHVKISGNFNIFQGKIKSNGDLDISGNNNTYQNSVRYYDEDKVEGSGNTYPAGEPQQEAFDAGWPGTLGNLGEAGNPLPACTFNFTSDKAMDPDTDGDGVYCGDGDTTFTVPSDSGWPDCGDFDPEEGDPYPQPCEGFTPKKWTFITGGKIDVSGENVHIVPFADNILGYTTNNNPDAIKWPGNEGLGQGVFFAPNGGIAVHGNENLFCMRLVAETIDVQGNENKWGTSCEAPPVEDEEIDPQGDIRGPCADPAYFAVFDNTASTVAITFRFRWYNNYGIDVVKKTVPAGSYFITRQKWVKPFKTMRIGYKDPDSGFWVNLITEQAVKGRYPACTAQSHGYVPGFHTGPVPGDPSQPN